jgi:hypothetical protein
MMNAKSFKNNRPKFTKIVWTKDNVKTLGIHHGYNIQNDEIWKSIIDQMKNVLVMEIGWTDVGSRGYILVSTVILVFWYSPHFNFVTTKKDQEIFHSGKLLIKFQNILRNTTQVIIRHRVKILFPSYQVQ